MRGLAKTLLIAALLVTTGCIGGLGDLDEEATEATSQATPDPQAVIDHARQRLVQDHEHNVLHEEHVGSIGFQPSAFVPARDSYPGDEAYHELAVKGDHAYLTFGPSSGFVNPGDEAGFFVYDVSDPHDPQHVGTWLGQPLGDIELTDDGAYVLASTQRNGYPYPYTIHQDAGPLGHAPRGTFIVDVTDPTSPETMSFAPLPTNGPHTITYTQHPDGRELVLQSTYDILFTSYPEDVGQNPATQKVVISELVRDGPEPQLVPLSTFQKTVGPEEEASHFPHDATVHVDPDDDRVIMDVAYWDFGLVTVDITDPADPTELATFSETGPSDYTQTHLVRVFPGTIDGKTTGVLEPEIPTGDDPGQFTFVDLSDPAKPEKLGHWSLPGNLVIDKPFVFSPHNFDLVCGASGQPVADAEAYGEPCEDPTVIASHFHAGLWALDASDPADPQPIGYFFPDIPREDLAPGYPFTGFPTAFVVDGHVFAPELMTGLHTLELDRISHPG